MPSPDLPGDAERLYDASDVDHAIDRLAVRMAIDLQDVEPILVCVMNGGLPFTAALMRRFAFPLELDYVHAVRYRGGSAVSGKVEAPRGGELEVRVDLTRDVTERVVVLADDVLDRGTTLARVAERISRAGAARVYTAVLVNKRVPGRDFVADYVALDAPDRYLVGAGMDCGGWFRNLNGIYALPDQGLPTP
ncbi:MAG: phosphoribosyltransferase family protein [Gammaproteobacteria bacterium]|nr:phosphoribosyltransferase family protein [Gammaproteobacteria bacterium]